MRRRQAFECGTRLDSNSVAMVISIYGFGTGGLTVWLSLLVSTLVMSCVASELPDKTVFHHYEDYVLTHQLIACGHVPTAMDPNGVYPYVSHCETANRPVLQKYTFLMLENRYMKVTISPDLGGKVTSMIHRRSGKEILYVPQVIRPTRILPRFYFVAGGIEVNFHISHSPSQNERVLYKVDRSKDRVYVTCGERELRFGMQWSVEYSLGPEDEFLTERVLFRNPGTSAYPWMSWSNAALPSAMGVAKALLARIYRTRGEMKLAATALEAIREHWLLTSAGRRGAGQGVACPGDRDSARA